MLGGTEGLPNQKDKKKTENKKTNKQKPTKKQKNTSKATVGKSV